MKKAFDPDSDLDIADEGDLGEDENYTPFRMMVVEESFVSSLELLAEKLNTTVEGVLVMAVKDLANKTLAKTDS